MSNPPCELCSRPMSDTAYVCSTCTKPVAEDLDRIVDYAGEVETAILKLVRYGGSGGGSGERPVPFDDARAERAAAVGNTVGTWARHVAESRGATIPRPTPMVGPLCRSGISCKHWSCERIRTRRMESGVATAAAWLGGRLGWLRHQPESPEMFRDLREASRELGRIVDRPRDLWYAGPCRNELADGKRCEAEIYAIPGKAIVKCRECKAEYDAVKRRDWLLREAREVLAHASLIAAALTALDMPVAVGTVWSWASRGRIVAHGSDLRGRPLYNVGEAIDLLSQRPRRVA